VVAGARPRLRLPQAGTPLVGEYRALQRANLTRYFAELAAYAREYAASTGREVQVSGNFFNLFDNYYALEPAVDVIVTEMRNTTWRQPAWYRYAAGFGGAKPVVVVVENPTAASCLSWSRTSSPAGSS
jgi:hypothetical protein